eukprot:352249-Chlamydomonas_euryale.AAC.14
MKYSAYRRLDVHLTWTRHQQTCPLRGWRHNADLRRRPIRPGATHFAPTANPSRARSRQDGVATCVAPRQRHHDAGACTRAHGGLCGNRAAGEHARSSWITEHGMNASLPRCLSARQADAMPHAHSAPLFLSTCLRGKP